MAILSNINGKFRVDSAGAVYFGTSAGTNGLILKSVGTGGSPVWVDPNTVGTGPWLPLAGGDITGDLTVGGTLGVTGAQTGTTATFTRLEINASNTKIKGDLLAYADAAYDIGASAANRPRNLYLSNSINAADITTTGVGTFGTTVTGSSIIGTSRVQSDDNMMMVAGQFYIGASGGSVDDTYRFYAASGVYYLQSRKSGTWTSYLEIASDGDATFYGSVTAPSFNGSHMQNPLKITSTYSSGNNDILFSGGSTTGVASNTTARIRNVATAPGGAATGDLIFTVNSGDTFVNALALSSDGNATFAKEISSGDDINCPTKIVLGESASPEVRLKKTDTGVAKVTFYSANSEKSYIELDASEDMVYYAISGIKQKFYSNAQLTLTLESQNATFGGDVTTVGNVVAGSSITLGASNGRVTALQGIFGSAFCLTSDGKATFGSTSSSIPIALAIDGDASTASIVVSTNKNVTIGGTYNYSGTGVKSLNIQATDYPVLAFYAGSTLRSNIVSFSNNTSFSHAAASAKWQFENGTAIMGELSGSGTLTVKGDVIAFGNPSDISLKENIKPISNSLDKVKKLQGVTFDWIQKEDQILDIKEDIGFIAQDVEKVIPELVRKNEDGLLSMRHQGIIPMLVEAIKELEARIKILENK